MWHAGERKVARRVCVGKPEGKRKWEDLGVYGRRIQILIFKEEYGGVDWTDLAWDREIWQTLVNKTVNLRFLSYAGNFLSSRGTISSSRTLFHGVSYCY
jgi:hypothetical protein